MPPPVQRSTSPLQAEPNPIAESLQSTLLSRFDLVIGGGYDFGSSLYSESDSSSRRKPQYGGALFILQPSVAMFWNQDFDLRLGGDLRYSSLSTAAQSGSDLKALSLGGLGEANFFPHAMLGIGLNCSLGYLGLMGNNLETSRGVAGRLNWESSGNFAFGTQFYLSTFFATGRLGVSIEKMFGDMQAKIGPSQIPTTLKYGPAFSVFAAVDPIRFLAIFANLAS